MDCYNNDMDQIELTMEGVANEVSMQSGVCEETTEQADGNKQCPKAALSFMEVKEIVAASYGENGKRCYKVAWKETWLYDDQLYDCDALIRKFWSQQPVSTTNHNQMKQNLKHKISPSKVQGQAKVSKLDDLPTCEGEMSSQQNVEAESNVTNSQININNLDDEQSKAEEEKTATTHLNNRKKTFLECHVCNETFDMVATMKRHYLDLHPETKPFACHLCHKRFDRRENMNRHIRIHTNDRKYICKHCKKGYTDPSGLKKHIIAKHSQSIISCDICGQGTFDSKDELNDHLTSHLEHIKDTLQGEKSPSKDSTSNDQEEKIILLAKVDPNANVEENKIEQDENDIANTINQIIIDTSPDGGEESCQQEEVNDNNVESNVIEMHNNGQFVAIPVDMNQSITTATQHANAVIISSQPEQVVTLQNASQNLPQQPLYAVAIAPGQANVVLQ